MAELNVAQSNTVLVPATPYLKFLSGPNFNQYVALDFGLLSHKPLVLGRLSREYTPDIILFDPEQKVSSHHAELQFRLEDGCLTIKDLASTNGTFLDGHRLGGVTPLLPGDIISCGKIDLIFGVPGWHESSELIKLDGRQRAIYLEDRQPGFGRLEILSTQAVGLHEGTFFRLTPQRSFCIGRLSENDLTLLDEITSRRHAEICWIGNSYVLSDCGAAIPTKISFEEVQNGVKVKKEVTLDTPHVLQDGDIIKIGTSTLRYRAPRFPYTAVKAKTNAESDTKSKQAKVGVFNFTAVNRSLEFGPAAFELPKNRQVLIGRADSNNLRLIDPSVSRRHARIGFEAGRYILTDLGAVNRCQVNGQEINAPTAIKIGDLVKIGDFEFTFSLEETGKAQTTLCLSPEPLTLQLGKPGPIVNSMDMKGKVEKKITAINHPLRKISPFDELDSVNFNKLAPLFKEVTFPSATEIAREGQNKGVFLAILDGTVTISHKLDTGDDLVLGEVGPGAIYGERTVYSNQPFGNTLKAKTAVKALQLDEATFVREVSSSKPIVTFFQQQVSLYSAINWLRGTVLMRTFSEKTLRELASRLRLRVYKPGEILTEKGQPCDEFYLVLTGRSIVYTSNSRGQDQELASLETGDTFGDGIAVQGETYPVTVRAATLTECYLLARADFENVLQNSGDPIASLPRGLSSLPISAVLNRVNPFSSMPPQLVAQIASKMRLKRFKKGETVLTQGDEASAFYIIKSGLVEVYFETSDGQRRKDDRLKAGQYFGEASLFTNTARTDTVVAAEDCELLALYRNNLEEVLRLGESYDLAQYFARNLSNRFRPKRAQNCILNEQTTTTGEHYYILSRATGETYFKLSDRSYYLWQLMDGDNSINDLSTAYFFQFKCFDGGTISHLVGQLQAGGFLELPPVDQKLMLGGTRKQSQWERITRKLKKVAKVRVQIKNLDNFFGKIYKYIGHIFFWKPITILLGLTILSGLGVFTFEIISSFISADQEIQDSLPGWLTFVILLLTLIVNVIVHETAHALAVKHYKRRVPSGGFGIGYFYVDTNEIWLESRVPRIVVNLAGPISNAFIGGVCSLLLLLYSPNSTAFGGLFLTMATIAFVLVYLNFNPYIESDGYYALMDWVELPGLRRKALVWLRSYISRNGDSQKTKPVEKRVYKLFGLLTLLYLPITIVLYLFVASQITSAIMDLFVAHNIAVMISLVLTALLGIYTIYNLITDLIRASVKTSSDEIALTPKRGRRRNSM